MLLIIHRRLIDGLAFIRVDEGPFVNFSNVSPRSLSTSIYRNTTTITTCKTYSPNAAQVTAIGISVGTVVDSYMRKVFKSSEHANAKKFHGIQIAFDPQQYRRLLSIFGELLGIESAYATMDQGGPLFATRMEPAEASSIARK